MKLFVFGCGYSAGAFCARLDPSHIVGATTRTTGKAATLAARVLRPYVFDGERPGEGIGAALGPATHLLVSIAPDGSGDPVLRHYRDTLARAMPALEWIGYLSTVGVYGDHKGAWVDEDTVLAPRSDRSRWRVEAEQGWTMLAEEVGVPLATLRLSGIYGPGRNAFVALREGRAKRLVKPGQVFNRIHVEDIAGALGFLGAKRMGGVFNVTDDEPAPPQDVVKFAANLARFPVPPAINFAEAELSTMARSFYSENKRVSNRKIRCAGYTFSYPNYRVALPLLTGDATFSPSPIVSGR